MIPHYHYIPDFSTVVAYRDHYQIDCAEQGCSNQICVYMSANDVVTPETRVWIELSKYAWKIGHSYPQNEGGDLTQYGTLPPLFGVDWLECHS